MGLIEQYTQQPFSRTVTSFHNENRLIESGSPIQTMGSSFILLSAKAGGSLPCRLRLYSYLSIMDIDANRPTGSFNLTQSVALVADIVLTTTNQFNFDPPIIGSTYAGNVYWTINTPTTTPTTITLTSYPIEENGGTGDDRTSLIITGSSVAPGSYNTRGTITSPKSFIILTGSADVPSRLRLYSRPIDEVPAGEITRTFGTAISDGALLIADLMFDSASFQYPLVPILEAYNWQKQNYAVGNNEVGYILENLTVSPATITASLYLYKTEN